MVKLTVLYKKPSDAQEFDRYYKEVHAPLAHKIPGLKKFEVSKVLGSPMGDSDYHLIATLYFDTMDTFKSAMGSEEGKASARDVKNFASGLTEMIISEIQ